MFAASVLLGLVIFQLAGRDPATFVRRAAEFDARTAALDRAAAGEGRAVAALEWLRALRTVLQAIPIERASGPHEAWLKTHDALVVYSEPAGEWLIGHDILDDIYEQHAASAAADEIAWLAVINRLPGECEGYVPCYAAGLNMLEGEYLRRHPRGAHRDEAFDQITESLRNVVDDLLKRPERGEYLTVPRDCDDLFNTARPLRAAVAGAAGAKTEAMALIARLLAHCPQ